MNYSWTLSRMDKNRPKRIFILGAGFSKPAGLPLGSELLQEITKYINNSSSKVFHEYKDSIQQDIDIYKEYSQKEEIKEINIEDLIEFIDYQHFLQFHGGLDANSSSSHSQSAIRILISMILNEKQKSIENKELYKKFITNLTDNDIIITLNYDILLESLLNEENKNYKLFPSYLCKKKNSTLPSITILKIHGSINWFDYNEYFKKLKQEKNCQNTEFLWVTQDFIFNNQYDWPTLNPIIPKNFKLEKNTRLKDIYWISDMDLNKYFEVCNDPNGRIFKKLSPATTRPVILSPSYTKLLYSQSIKDLFYSASSYGQDTDKIIIIGCSLTKYDRYIRQWVYDICQQYRSMHTPKSDILIVNYASNCKQKNELKKNYSFIQKFNISLEYDGFTEKTLKKF